MDDCLDLLAVQREDELRRDELQELHYITPIANVPSIRMRGILSHRRAGQISHRSVAMDEVQDRRARKRVPGGLMLHDYVNLYICARNPMIYKRKEQHNELCVLSVNTDVLDLNEVVVTDRNASRGFVRFGPIPGGLTNVDYDMVFARSWKHPDDPELDYLHSGIKCAEILVPNCVAPGYIRGAYVSCRQSQMDLLGIAPDLTVTINPGMFFL